VPYNTCALIHPTLLDTHVIRIGNISFLFYTPLSITHILSSTFLQAPCPHPHSHSLHALFLHLSNFILLKLITHFNFKPSSWVFLAYSHTLLNSSHIVYIAVLSVLLGLNPCLYAANAYIMLVLGLQSQRSLSVFLVYFLFLCFFPSHVFRDYKLLRDGDWAYMYKIHLNLHARLKAYFCVLVSFQTTFLLIVLEKMVKQLLLLIYLLLKITLELR